MRVVFGAFTLDLDRRELYRQDRVQPLEPKAFRCWRICSRIGTGLSPRRNCSLRAGPGSLSRTRHSPGVCR